MDNLTLGKYEINGLYIKLDKKLTLKATNIESFSIRLNSLIAFLTRLSIFLPTLGHGFIGAFISNFIIFFYILHTLNHKQSFFSLNFLLKIVIDISSKIEYHKMKNMED